MSVLDDGSIKPYVPPEGSVPPESSVLASSVPVDSESPSPRVIPLAAAMRQRQALGPVDSPPDPHDLFGIFYPPDERPDSEPASEVAAAIIPGPFLNDTTTLDTNTEGEPDAVTVEGRPHGSEPSEPSKQSFRPLLEVGGLVWPIICGRLEEEASDEIDHLADALVDAMRWGQTVLGMAGCRSGEGSTTLLLSAARQLGERRLKLAVVDAHLTRPELAQRLGLSPQSGWEDVLAGRLPLAEVAVESVEDRLTVIPLCQPISREEADAEADDDEPSAMERGMLETIDTLADHYDLVLVDVGPLDDLTAAGGVLVGRLDAFVLVHNPAVTTESQLAETQHKLANVEITQVGIVRNFIRVQALACG